VLNDRFGGADSVEEDDRYSDGDCEEWNNKGSVLFVFKDKPRGHNVEIYCKEFEIVPIIPFLK